MLRLVLARLRKPQGAPVTIVIMTQASGWAASARTEPSPRGWAPSALGPRAGGRWGGGECTVAHTGPGGPHCPGLPQERDRRPRDRGVVTGLSGATSPVRAHASDALTMAGPLARTARAPRSPPPQRQPLLQAYPEPQRRSGRTTAAPTRTRRTITMAAIAGAISASRWSSSRPPRSASGRRAGDSLRPISDSPSLRSWAVASRSVRLGKLRRSEALERRPS